MLRKSRRSLRGALKLGSAVAIALSSTVAFSSTPAAADTGDTWDVIGRSAGDTTSTTINGYTATNGMGIYELQHTGTGETDYALCIDPTIDHSPTDNYEHGTNTVTSHELDYLLWKYVNGSTGYVDAMAAQGLAWYYVGGMRSTPAVPVWWDTANNIAVTPFDPDPWNALPVFGYTAPQKPVGFQQVSDFNTGFDPGEDNVEIALYNMALDVETNRGPWTLTPTETQGQVMLSNPVNVFLNPEGRVANVEVQWFTDTGQYLASTTTDANGLASDPTNGSADQARVVAPGVHREANVDDLQMLALPGSITLTAAVSSNSEPSIVTQISTDLAVVGVPISDTVFLSGMQGANTATVRLQLFNLVDDPTGSGTPLVDVTIPDLGNGTHSGLGSYTPTFADAGDTLGYREMIVSTTDGASTGWSQLGITNETAPVAISDPDVATQISTDLAVAGETITDSIAVTGLVGGATADVQLQLFNLTDDPLGEGTPLVDVTVSDLGNGTTSGHAPYVVTFADAGDTLGYRERIVSTSDGLSSGWSSLGVASETTPVDVSEPVISTQISSTLVTAGEVVSDSITISGLVGGATADVELQLFNLTHDPNGTGTPLVYVTISGLSNGTTSGHGSYTATFADAGDNLGYRERIVSTSDGLSTEWSQLGITNETTPVDVSDPAVVTQISTSLALAGETISDAVTISGLVGGATADVQLQLFNLTDDPDGTGTPLVDVTIPNLVNGTTSGLASYVVAFTDAGDTLGYRERVISTSDGQSTEWSELGISNETTAVDISDPSVVTQISDYETSVGDVITDTLTVSGLVGDAVADVQLQLFNLTDDPNGTGTPLMSVTIENLTNGVHSGLGSYTVSINDAGDRLGYRERIVFTSDGLSTEWSELGIPSETTTVGMSGPSVITQTTNAVILLEGDSYMASDMLSIAGMYGSDWTAEVTLYGPFESTEEIACLADHEVGMVSMSGTGNQVVHSPTIEVTEGGVYTFVAEVTRSSDSQVASHSCGMAAETVTVTIEVPELPATGPSGVTQQLKLALILAVTGLVLATAASRRRGLES